MFNKLIQEFYEFKMWKVDMEYFDMMMVKYEGQIRKFAEDGRKLLIRGKSISSAGWQGEPTAHFIILLVGERTNRGANSRNEHWRIGVGGGGAKMRRSDLQHYAEFAIIYTVSSFRPSYKSFNCAWVTVSVSKFSPQ